MRVLSGRDPHHVVEAQFKAVARALRAAVEPDPRVSRRPQHQGQPVTSTASRRTPRVVVLDYGFGNVRSAVRALERVGAAVQLTADRTAAQECDGLVVPGVGAFAAVLAGLSSRAR